MRLRDEGLLDLNDPLEQHVPGTPFGAATVAQLLSHTSGLTSESPGLWWERTPGADWDALAGSLAEGATKHRPGARFHYSNVGYGVLGELVARHRGKGWLSVLDEEILGPLGMTRTTPHPVGAHADGFAVHPFADILLPEPSPDAGAMAPAGQLWSTATDLGRWTAFLGGHGGGVLAPDTIEEMRTMVTVDDTDVWTTGFGLGLMLVRYRGRRLAGHTGSMPGFLAVTLVDPVAQTGALVLTNSTSGVGITQLCLDLITTTDELEPRLPAEWEPSAVDPDAAGADRALALGPDAVPPAHPGGRAAPARAGRGRRAQLALPRDRQGHLRRPRRLLRRRDARSGPERRRRRHPPRPGDVHLHPHAVRPGRAGAGRRRRLALNRARAPLTPPARW